MFCPNCGLSNPDNARFCANCGTPLGGAATGASTASTSPGIPPPSSGFNTRNIALGCLVVLLLALFFMFSCGRACFGFRRGRSYYVHRRYAYVPRATHRSAPPSADSLATVTMEG